MHSETAVNRTMGVGVGSGGWGLNYTKSKAYNGTYL